MFVRKKKMEDFVKYLSEIIATQQLAIEKQNEALEHLGVAIKDMYEVIKIHEVLLNKNDYVDLVGKTYKGDSE